MASNSLPICVANLFVPFTRTADYNLDQNLDYKCRVIAASETYIHMYMTVHAVYTYQHSSSMFIPT